MKCERSYILTGRSSFLLEFLRYISLLDPSEEMSSQWQSVYSMELAKVELKIKLEDMKQQSCVNKEELTHVMKEYVKIKRAAMVGLSNTRLYLN